ncbi:MAG: response regulator [Planctomycetia bacterium]|nr:response regulator [Planctomycetia bacterium]
MLAHSIEPQHQQPCGCKILIADDNQAGSWILGRLLNLLGSHQIQLAANGPSALNQIQQNRPDIVLLDIGMPGMDGYQVAKEIRSQPELDQMLLVAFTGYGQAEDRQRAVDAGFDLHLLKPASLQELKEMLQHPKLPSRRASPEKN